MKRRALKRAAIAAGVLTASIAILLALFYGNELRSLRSLQKLDDYPMYAMTYYGDYGFDDFLSVGAKSDAEIEQFVTKRLLKGLPIDLGITGAGCTAFVAGNPDGDIWFARNFDFDYSPSLIVQTKPKNGYASISTVNLTFAGYSKDRLPQGLMRSFLTLAAPYLPFDGMNEKGLAVALLAVPEVQRSNDPGKITLNTTTAIRLMLDKAATIDEAIALLREYNLYFSGGITCHYLLADQSGNAVIAEFWDGGVQVVDENVASNFVAYNGLNIGEGYTEFERYDTVKSTLAAQGGVLTEAQATELLAEVGVYHEGSDRLQWSVLYNLTSFDAMFFAHRNTENIHTMRMQPYWLPWVSHAP
ncbi:MAG: linear amide C-N hydrolase [Firmicutes bacterium]|nr:linear amide C-N hydrolase [Bacillota bacterium]